MWYDCIIQYKINNQINSPELRVITETGDNLGVMTRDQALTEAKARGLDLIEIAPQANPPVAKIIGFDKFRYQQEKEEKKKRLTQKTKDLKQVRITPRAGKNDLMVKIRKVEEFLGEGHKVEINLFLRGREKGNKDWGLQKLNEFLAMITVPHQVTLAPKPGGRGFITQVTKK
ncbi:MAG: translation initiation factor IF-3 [Parcubacteria group bacterium LiPW_41]|nr:MAG: translation initiation factor IF-3 [Parcubacteria group bacterium LiPW_41]